jgi:hypothetical protein
LFDRIYKVRFDNFPVFSFQTDRVKIFVRLTEIGKILQNQFPVVRIGVSFPMQFQHFFYRGVFINRRPLMMVLIVCGNSPMAMANLPLGMFRFDSSLWITIPGCKPLNMLNVSFIT